MNADSKLLSLSVRTYPLLLRAFPTAFRQEFGESMAQTFNDLARAAWRTSGRAGLALLWLRIVRDLLLSVGRAYSMERSMAMTRAALWTGILYLGGLTAVAGYGGFRYQEFYERPAFSNVGRPQPLQDDAALGAYGRALDGDFGRYRTFAQRGGLVIAILLGLGAAFFGISQKSLLHGALAFAGGAALTLAAFEVLPAIWFPFDQYSPAFVWFLSGLPLAAGIWLLATAVGRLAPRLRRRPG